MTKTIPVTDEEIILSAELTKEEWLQVFILVSEFDNRHENSVFRTVSPPANKHRCMAILEVISRRKPKLPESEQALLGEK